MRIRRPPPFIVALLALTPFTVAAAEFSYSGYGTLGVAGSDRPYTYQRFIDDRGTLKRDSVAGIQVDAKFFDTVGATVQAKLAPASASDGRYEATISWAFLTWRPSNDWLFRAGKQRIPLYLYSQNYDVGATYDFARLPTEMYSLVPSNDALGVSVTRTWTTDVGDFVLDGYWGKSKNHFRSWRRDDIPGVQRSGALFTTLDFTGGGIVLAYKAQDHTFRIGVHRALVEQHNGQPLLANYPFVALAPGIGYYQVDESLPGPGLRTTPRVTDTAVTIGAEFGLSTEFRVVAEVARDWSSQTDFSPQGTRGYAALLRRFGKWTPYVSYAFMRSTSTALNIYSAVNGSRVPAAVPGSPLLNASQRAGADQIFAFDQRSVAIGTSYSLSPTSKLKAEVMSSHIGTVSNLVDAPPGSDIRNQSITVLSLSYSFVF